MTMPNFLIIGAMKSGTTALYYYLQQHPEIYMSPVKEPNFFAFEGEEMASRLPGDPKGINRVSVTDLEDYRSLFKRASAEKARGEASHWYLYKPKAAARIQHHIPEAKMIAVLRNPVERAYSHFLHSVRTGTEPLTDFSRALAEEASSRRGKPRAQDYVGRGLYHAQLTRYLESFGRGRIKVYLYEDLNDAPMETLRDVFRFLEVDETFVPDISLRHNISGFPRNRLLDNVLRRPHPLKRALKLYLPAGVRRGLSGVFHNLKTRNLTSPPPFPPEVREHLAGLYREDILKLQELMDRDLSDWLEPAPAVTSALTTSVGSTGGPGGLSE